jgi:hypothetical protein
MARAVTRSDATVAGVSQGLVLASGHGRSNTGAVVAYAYGTDRVEVRALGTRGAFGLGFNLVAPWLRFDLVIMGLDGRIEAPEEQDGYGDTEIVEHGW